MPHPFLNFFFEKKHVKFRVFFKQAVAHTKLFYQKCTFFIKKYKICASTFLRNAHFGFSFLVKKAL